MSEPPAPAEAGLPGDAPPPGSPRVARKREARRRLILAAAAEAFAERGYEGANLEEIGARIDLRGPSLYHYVGSKEELFGECLRMTAEEVMARVRAAAGDGDRPAVERLRAMFREQVLVQVRDYPQFVPLFTRVRVPEAAIRDRIRALRREHGDIFRGVVDEGVASGELDAAGARNALLLAFGAVAFIQDWHDPHGPLSPTELADAVADRVVRLFAA